MKKQLAPVDVAGKLAVHLNKKPMMMYGHVMHEGESVPECTTTECTWGSVLRDIAGGPAFVLIHTDNGQMFMATITEV